MKNQMNYKNGIANFGNLNRLKNLMERAAKGEELKIGFIGGSITQGSLSSTPETCYAYRVYRWWCENFPAASFSYINAGIGGTTSQFGVARVQEDLLEKKPDFVIIEFSVNDDSTEHFMETYEGLVRRVYGAEWKPAVLLVHNVYYHNGANAQLMHGRIGRHYQLPALSMQSSIYQEVVAGRIDRRGITPDDLHPNDAGHVRVAAVINYFLGQVLQNMRGLCTDGDMVRTYMNALQNAGEEDNAGLPAPLTQNAYENSQRFRNDNCEPKLAGFVKDEQAQDGITDCFKKGWTASSVGDGITFKVKGGCIAVQYRRSVKLPAPVAVAIVDGDEANAVRLDGNFDETWGDKLELTTVLEHGENQEHTLEIRLVEVHEEDAVPFYLVSVIVSE